MSRFTFWKGFADAVTGVILLTKPEIIYHSFVAKGLHRISGLRVPSPYPESADGRSAQHAVAIMVTAIGLAHMRASNDRKAIPAFVLMDALWSLFALLTVILVPHRATSALLMTGINHSVFATGMALTAGIGIREIFGFNEGVREKNI